MERIYQGGDTIGMAKKIQSCRNECGTFIYVALHDGKWKPFDSQTNQLHDCPNSPYNKQNQNQSEQVQDQRVYKITSSQQQIPVTGMSREQVGVNTQQYNPALEQTSTSTTIAQLHTKVDNLNIAIAKVMSMLQIKQDLEVDPDDVSRLRTENAQLRDVLKGREDNFVPANQVQVKQEQQDPEEESQQDHDQHVRDMVAKGREEEELDLT